MRLKADTRDEHQATEATPHARRLARGQVSRTAYAAQLWVWEQWWRCLERDFAREPALRALGVWQDDMAKSRQLRADHRALTPGAGPPSSLDAWLGTEDRQRRAQSPWWRLGELYVLEGSTLGGEWLAPRIEAALELGRPLVHLRPYPGGSGAHFAQFRERLDRAVTDEPRYGAVLAGARATFATVRSLFARLAEADS